MIRRQKEPRWLDRAMVVAIHADQIRQHGGLHGVRDAAVLESALARAKNRWHYDAEVELHDLAASYGFGLTRNHPFMDGNKRIALTIAAVFLELNGFSLDATEAEAVLMYRQLAAGTLTEDELAIWIRDSSIPSGRLHP